MNDKQIILITGMFTSGKSTIVNNIIRDNDNVFVIPQATIRKRRDDDNGNFYCF